MHWIQKTLLVKKVILNFSLLHVVMRVLFVQLASLMQGVSSLVEHQWFVRDGHLHLFHYESSTWYELREGDLSYSHFGVIPLIAGVILWIWSVPFRIVYESHMFGPRVTQELPISNKGDSNGRSYVHKAQPPKETCSVRSWSKSFVSEHACAPWGAA